MKKNSKYLKQIRVDEKRHQQKQRGWRRIFDSQEEEYQGGKSGRGEGKAKRKKGRFIRSKVNKVQDGSKALKYELNQSRLRMEAAKHGYSLEEIAPPHSLNFYLPNTKSLNRIDCQGKLSKRTQRKKGGQNMSFKEADSTIFLTRPQENTRETT